MNNQLFNLVAGSIINSDNWKHCQPWVVDFLSVGGVDGVAVYELGDGDHAEVGLVAPESDAIVWGKK